MKRLLDVALALTTMCALVVTALVVRREFFTPAPVPQGGGPRQVEEWQKFASSGSRMGAQDAPVVIVEFSDFQCPFCKTFASALKAVQEKYPTQVAVVYRHFPLDAIHPHARTAALASECAGAQRHFQPYHDALYARQDSIGAVAWRTLAQQAGVPDLDAFDACVAQKTFAGRIEDDVKAATELGVRATPSFLLNGTLHPGAVSEPDLLRMVEAAIGERR